MDLHSALMAMEDKRLNENGQFHKDRLAEEGQTRLGRTGPGRTPRNERRMKEEEIEYRRREVSAKEDASIHASILGIAQFVLPSMSGDTVEAYKKARYHLRSST